MMSTNKIYYLVAMVIAIGVTGCAQLNLPAPVSDHPSSASAKPTVTTAAAMGAKTVAVPSDTRAAFYVVKPGDTLHSIALEYGQNYRDIARWNQLDNPHVVPVGKLLRVLPPTAQEEVGATSTPIIFGTLPPRSLTPANTMAANTAANTATNKIVPQGGKVPYSDAAYARMSTASIEPTAAVDKPAETSKTETTAHPVVVKTVATDAINWAWPTTQGKVVELFSERNKGIDMAAQRGDSVFAAADGNVVYSGNGMRGYGNLIVVRHNQDYSSVYAHNDKIFVNEGQAIKRGQKIAEIGLSDTGTPMLHFEIRYQGKPLNPSKFLPERK